MSKKKVQKKKNGTVAFIIALICLVNPSIHVIDIFPDFIAHLIIAGSLGFAAKRAPYFEEARAAFMKLTLLTAAKLPGFVIIAQARAQVSNDNDIYSLFAFSFAVIEAVLIYQAVNNLFLGLFYLGERGDADALIKPFRTSGKRGKYASVEGLRLLTLAFTIFKCAAYSLPELLLLTRGVNAGDYAQTFNIAVLYPYTIIFTVIATPCFGIFWAIRCAKYRRAIIDEDKFVTAIEAMFDEKGLAALEKKLWLGKMRAELTLATVASFFTFDIIFSDFKDINLLPHTIFAIIMTVSAAKIAKHTGKWRGAIIISGAVYCVTSLAAYVSSVIFLSKYSYESLVTSSSARANYQPTVILSWIEFGAFVVFLAMITLMLIRFTRLHTGLLPESDRYMRPDIEYHGAMKRRTLIWAVIGALAGLAKAVQVHLKSSVNMIYIGIDDGLGGNKIEPVAEQILPWFGIVVVATTILFIAASLHYFGMLKSDTEIKYGSD